MPERRVEIHEMLVPSDAAGLGLPIVMTVSGRRLALSGHTAQGERKPLPCPRDAPLHGAPPTIASRGDA